MYFIQKNQHTNKISRIIFAFIAFLILTSLQPLVQRLDSQDMLTASIFTSKPHNKGINKVFTFAPGWALYHLNSVVFDDLHTVAYFDVAASEDGTLYRDNDGYSIFRERVSELVEKAHSQRAKVVLTVTQADDQAIKTIVKDLQVQETLINEVVAEIEETGIDGVNIDFDFKGEVREASRYRGDFSKFMKNLSDQVHKRVKKSQVSVSLSDKALKNSLYDIEALGKTSDYIFISAYNFAAPEMKGSGEVVPLYGYNEKDYWNKVGGYLDTFLKHAPSKKLVLERAWYGNGNNYPLPAPQNDQSSSRNNQDSQNTMSTPLSKDVVERTVESVPDEAKPAVRKNLPIIAKALERERILNPNVLAYALATIEHETAGTFEPIEEFSGRKSARRLGYEGGTNYFGRGFIQLTHLRNYKIFGERIGLGDALVRHPELALKTDISARILAAFFKDNGIATLAGDGNFVDARTPINPDYLGWWIANLAWKYVVSLS